MAEAKVVASVTHHARDAQGRRLGHVGEVERRGLKAVATNGGKRFAAWTRLTADGVPIGLIERFDTFATEAQAVKHATTACKTRKV